MGSATAKSLTEQKAYFEAHPPRLLKSFSFEGHALDDVGIGGHREPLAFTYLVKCNCDSIKFSLLAHRIENDAGIFWVSPIELSCQTCGSQVQIFDNRSLGYDGELGHNDFMEVVDRGKLIEIDRQSATPILLTFHYPDDLFEEEFETPKGLVIPPEDLFTWFSIAEQDDAGALNYLVEEECA